jgi:predicted nucleotidyltransferase
MESEKKDICTQVKDALAPVFDKIADRLAAVYLFGSTVTGKTGAMSDLDLAVLLVSYDVSADDTKMQLYLDCSRALKRNDIDIVVLNRAGNLFLIHDIVTNGVVIFDGNPSQRAQFEVLSHHRFIEFRDHRLKVMGV